MAEPPRGHARPDWGHRPAHTGWMLDRFELVLVFVLATIVVQALIDVRGSVLAQLFVYAISGAALFVAARAAGVRRTWRRAVDLVIGVVLLVSVAVYVSERMGGGGAAVVPPATIWLLAAALTPVLVARRLLQHEVVTGQTVVGAVAAYLQIAVAYAYAFQTVDAYTSSPFFGEAVPTTAYMYFSLITMTTVGYGDLLPVTDMARLLASSEAVVGQVFLVTFVAFIVSRFATTRHRR